MSITLEVNGQDFEGFTQIAVTRSFMNMSGAFSFSAVDTLFEGFPIEVNDSCVIKVNEKPVITGFIERITIDYSSDTHNISITGRDRTCDVIDSTIDNRIIYSPPITLKRVIENTLNVLSIQNIKVIDTLNLPAFTETLIQSAQLGDTFFSFIENLARVSEAVLTTDGLGNIVIARASTEKISTLLLNQLGNDENNIVSASVTYDNTQRFNSYTAYAQANPVGLIGNLGDLVVESLTDLKGSAVDSAIRPSRTYSFISEKSTTNQDLTERAKWEANMRRAKSKVYNCVVQGFEAQADGFLWKPNLLVQVVDDMTGVDGLLLISEVTYNFSLDSGSTTNLSLVVQDAFTLQAEQDARDARVNAFGRGYIA